MKLAKTYEPQAYEADIYKLWEASGAFEPSGDGEPFALIMPPPNANAPLHMGQVTYVKQDLKSRYERMKGKKVLYLPGADHAGFETWYVFEKELAKEGKSKLDFNDDELYKMTYDFVVKNMGMAKNSYRRLGLSCSWDNFTFTLDEKITSKVKLIFKKMWDEGLVYRGKRLVNFCTYHGTSFSDIEVEYDDKKTGLYYIKYGPFEIATTRPETIMGDTAVAVHPDDERYKEFVGQELEIEGPDGVFKVKVVADDELVNQEFGTGVVKITPAHDFNDNDLATRHDLPVIEVIGKDGKMNSNAGRFEGMTVLDAREAVVEALKEKGLLIKVDEDYVNRVGVCYKCRTTIEPLMMEQWFVDMKPLAKKAITAIEADEVKFKPENRKQIGLDYLNNIRDWNISRQIPWGIRIPAFYNAELDKWIYSDEDVSEVEVDGKTYLRDRDTFDTWMSSSQFPYLALEYPENEELKEFFPTSWIHMGREIFGFWGLRMIMMSLLVNDQVPFKTLYVNGNIRSEDGRKMSKSFGNNIAAGEMLDEYGSDATRMGMIAIDSSPGSDKAFSRSKLVAGRNFANKLWNIARFTENLLDERKLKISEVGDVTLKFAADHWIVSEIEVVRKKIENLLDGDDFGEAFNRVYDLVWNKFADWYLEASKSELNLTVLAWALDTVLKLAHPFAPFVTETIWQGLESESERSLLVSECWPKKVRLEIDEEEVLKFKNLISATEFARSVKAVIGSEIEVSCKDESLARLTENMAGLKPLNSEGSEIVSELAVPMVDGWSLLVSGNNLEKYREKIGERIDKVQEEIKRLESRLANSSYVEKAPQKLIEDSRLNLSQLQTELKELKSQ
jgi:valyl-tRNA synthetase